MTPEHLVSAVRMARTGDALLAAYETGLVTPGGS